MKGSSVTFNDALEIYWYKTQLSQHRVDKSSLWYTAKDYKTFRAKNSLILAAMAFENNEYNLENRLGEATRGLECQEPCYVNIKRTRRRLFVRAVLREQSEQQRMMGDIYDPKAIARISSSRSIWSKNAALLEALRDEKCAKEHQRARTKLLATNKTWLVQ